MKYNKAAGILRSKSILTLLFATVAVAASSVRAQDITWTIDGALEQIS